MLFSRKSFWFPAASLLILLITTTPLHSQESTFSLTVERAPGEPIEGIRCYAFTETGSYLGLHQTTGADGRVSFDLADGAYKIRADYMGYRFWTDVFQIPSTMEATLPIPHQDVTVTVNGVYGDQADPKQGLRVYLFTPSGSYMGRYLTTDSEGRATFNLPERPYKVRADYMAGRFWSQEFTWQDTTVEIPMGEAAVAVDSSSGPLPDVRVYAFTESGSYLGLYQETGTGGEASFILPQGIYSFRADYQGSRYWSDEIDLAPHQVNPVEISTGGGTFSLTVERAPGEPIEGIRCYAFTETGSYLGLHQTTGADGRVSFDLADGSYKIRADYLGYRFWTDVFQVPSTMEATLPIPHQDVTVTVNGVYGDQSDPKQGLRVYLFTPSGSYMGLYTTTDSEGRATFNLPERPYKVRADYMAGRFWSQEFTWQDTTVEIPMGEAAVTVDSSSGPLPDVRVYAFTESGSYLGLYQNTGTGGEASFILPQGIYSFRADYQGSRYWSDEIDLAPHQVNPVEISTGGGTFSLTVERAPGEPIEGIRCYAFTETGSYLGLHQTTDADGRVSFDLADGSYKIRADYLGYRFWTDVFQVPSTMEATLPIPHQDVTVTVNGVYGDQSDPKQGLRVYLFTPSGSYMGRYFTTDQAGQATFQLPERPYKVRADYMAGRFWSQEFTWQDTTVEIPAGEAKVTVDSSSGPLQDVRVYAFTESGSYLGLYQNTGTGGEASFILPQGIYSFRADYQGSRYWSDEIDLAPHQVNPVAIAVETAQEPTASISASPLSIRPGGFSVLTWTSTHADTAFIEPEIGEVEPESSVTVYPTETTAYTLTVTGPGGSAQDAVQVSVVSPPEDIDLGLWRDEQEGGGGLLAESLRILNGNAIEHRMDLQFPSPCTLGVSFKACYNSLSNREGDLGHGWHHTYSPSLDADFTLEDWSLLRIEDETGRAHYFEETDTGSYKGVFNEPGYVEPEAEGLVWHRPDGSRLCFDQGGRLTWIEDERGNRLSLGYDTEGRLANVQDLGSGRSLNFHHDGEGRMIRITGPVTQAVPDGVWVTYQYAGGNLIKVIYADGSGFNYDYSDPGDPHNLTEKRNPAGHLLKTWSYDSQDRAVGHSCTNGRGVSAIYEGDALVHVTDDYGTQRTYTLTTARGRKRISSMSGLPEPPYTDANAMRWVYDQDLNLIEVEYASDAVTRYLEHDSRGNPGRVIVAHGTAEEKTILYTYHPEINVPLSRTEASVLSAGFKVTTWDYDSDGDDTPNEVPGRLLHRIVEQGYTTDETGNVVPYEYVTSFTHNERGQLVAIDGPRPGPADTTSFSYAPATGNLLELNRPLIGSTTFTNYDEAGRPRWMTDVNGQSLSFRYDGRGRLTEVTNESDGSTRTMTYNLAGKPESMIDEDGIARFFSYDEDFGRLTRITDAEGSYIQYGYDSRGNRTRMSKHSPDGTQVYLREWDYDHPSMPGKLFKEILPNGAFTQYDYDGGGNISSRVDPEGNETTYGYDLFNRITEIVQPNNAIITYGYDGRGNLVSVIDPKGRETSFSYDDMGRLISTTSPDRGAAGYSYDQAGNLISKEDSRGVRATFDYDSLNRLAAATYPDPNQNVTYTYDTGTFGLGRMTGIQDESGQITFEYDARGRLIEANTTISSNTYTFSRSYSPGGRLMSVTYPTGRTLNYTRDDLGRMSGLSTTHDSTTNILVSDLTYEPFGLPNGMETGAGGEVENHFGDCGCIQVANPGSRMEQIYTYDNNLNLIEIAGTNTPWYNQSFTYDDLGHLIHAQGSYGEIEYTYDTAGNRTNRTINGVTESYSYIEGTNRLHRITGADQTEFSYDENGNTTGIGELTLIYNQHNRLVKVEQGASVLGEYTYNALGQRTVKEAEGNTTIFLYDPEGKLIAESDANGNILSEYLYMGKIRIAKTDAETGDIYYYLNDRLGTPLMMTDESNTIIWEAMYQPFGRATVHPASTVENHLRFPGQYEDTETGLHYNYHRYYDPISGRYLRPDPYGPIDGINSYVYGLNDPIQSIDPRGLWHIDIGITGAATGVLGPGGAIGIKVGPSGVHLYYGFGFGIGAGATGVFHWSDPCEQVSVTGNLRGGYPVYGVPIGGELSVGLGQQTGLSADVGAGLGIGIGASITAMHTIKIIDW